METIRELYRIPVHILWQPERRLPLHPNGMQFVAIFADGSSSEL